MSAPAKFTPGPWEVFGLSSDGIRPVSANGAPPHTPVALALTSDGAYPSAEYAANARLIAAAPSMYDALKLALPFLRMYEPPDATMEEWDLAINAVTVAISRATEGGAK